MKISITPLTEFYLNVDGNVIEMTRTEMIMLKTAVDGALGIVEEPKPLEGCYQEMFSNKKLDIDRGEPAKPYIRLGFAKTK